ncbi:MAG: insulinase family protein, partial [Limnobacter sp.]|nr:insulinase family protein [Limnobacter sp.]
QIGLQTQREQTGEALAVVRSTLSDFLAQGPAPEELEAAKANLAEGFPLRIDSNADLVNNLTMMGVYDLPLDYLDTWADNIRRVSLQSARQAFSEVVKTDKLVTVVVGNAKAVQ